MVRAALAVLLVVGLSGCPGKTIDEFCLARFDAMVARDVRCGTPQDLAEASWGPVRDYVCHGVTGLEQAKLVTYDSGKAAACLERLGKLECGLLRRVADDPCDLALVGQVATGGACYTGVECVPGALCASTSCPGRCVARVEVGGACGGVARCVDGAVCLQGACVVAAALGEPCRVGSIDCDDGLYCAGATPLQSTPGRCEAAAARASGACDQPLACAFGTVCAGLDYSTNSAGACQAPAAQGAACQASTFCDVTAFCREGKCQTRPRVGDPCGTLAGGNATCLTGWCKLGAGAAQGTCTAFLAPGEACDTVEACGPIARCEQSRCVALCAAP